MACSNLSCRELTLKVSFGEGEWRSGGEFVVPKAIHKFDLMPAFSFRAQPAYIPAALREDYEEACKIRDLSPKASATLARRCLQGMIRDFCGIAKATLDQEIKELRKKLDDRTAPSGVTHESLDAIDAVRKVGNIGAHMEKDVDLIVGIEPGEAQMLIGLIEMLFREWYVERHDRTNRLATITALAEEKKKTIEELKAGL
ncbi:hypothetical protein C7G41_24205 [Bradyrhizobium sp. MOS002]|nr:hypothetical protein C7G41_24205 [Bradyrhizobium sp. MOS002]